MNCEDLKRTLARGEPVTGALADHVRNCPGCRALLQALMAPEELPDQQRLDRVAAQITASLRIVRPLPSDGKMMLFAFVSFVVFACLMTIPFGYDGFHRLSAFQKGLYHVTLAVLGLFFSLSTVEAIVPGSKLRVSPLLVVVGSVVLLAIVSVVLFPQFGLQDFTEIGVPCLQLGLACAALGSGFAVFFVRKGYSVSPVWTGTVVGSFGGLLGVAVLALHCVQQNAAHVLVWHIGAMVISAVTGAVLGYFVPPGEPVKAIKPTQFSL